MSKDGRKKQKKRPPIVVHLTDVNDTWLRSLAAESGSSVNKVVNAMILYLQDHDTGFKAPKHVPVSVRKAQEILAKWEKRGAKVAAMPQAIAAAEVKKSRGRPKRTGNEVIADRS